MRETFTKLPAMAVLIVTLAGLSLAQTPSSGRGDGDQTKGQPSQTTPDTTAVRGEQPSNRVIVASSDDYLIEPSDVLDVQVMDASELSRKVVVGADGTFTMPYLNTVAAKDKTTLQLEREIEDRLRGRYLKDPQVTVSVLQYNSRTFFIQGAVRSPGTYMISGKATLLKLITIAGGLAENHGSSAFIIREVDSNDSAGNRAAQAGSSRADTAAVVPAAAKAEGGHVIQASANTSSKAPDGVEHQLIKVDINQLFRGDFTQDAIIQPGDIVNIPASDIFFVVGEVRRAGYFTLRDGITVQQAISMAEGLTNRAAAGSAVIFRIDPITRKRQEIKVDVAAVLKGKAPDIPVMANDTIVIPNSKSKTVLTTLFNGFGMSALRMPLPY